MRGHGSALSRVGGSSRSPDRRIFVNHNRPIPHMNCRARQMSGLDQAAPFKVGSVAAIGGAVLLLVSTMLHPMSADPADPVAAFREYAADRFWVATHLGQFVGIALIFVGLYALRQSLA